MAIHIQMSEEAEAQLRSINLRNKLSSIFACFAFLGIGTAILYLSVIYIETSLPPAFDVYVPAGDDAPSRTPKVKELTTKQTRTQAVVTPNITVASDASAIAMAPIDIPIDDVAMDMGMSLGLEMDAGLGDGLGSAGGGLGSGDSGGSALEGTFYDLKQTRNAAAIARGEYGVFQKKFRGILTEFHERGWSDSIITRYYQSPKKLYSSSFLLQSTSAKEIVKFFGVQDKVDPEFWCLVYRGKVRAPHTGTYRFVGQSLGLFAVRFNKKMVLESGRFILTGSRDGANNANYLEKITTFPGKEDYKVYETKNVKIVGGTNWGGLVGGNVFSVEEGKVYDIEIIFADRVGDYGFALFIEDVNNPKTKDGFPIFDVFRTNFNLPDKGKVPRTAAEKKEKPNAPAEPFFDYNEDSPIWTAVPK